MSTLRSSSSHPVARLEGTLRPYAWGSHTAIAAIQQRPYPTSEPEAELWFGAHPASPALLHLGGDRVPLDRAIREAPEAMLGAQAMARFGPQLPFLLKILAIERPLSLQAHPSADQAAQGFQAEQERGVPIDAPQRTYRDGWPKPELLCALSEVDALAGFRDTDATGTLLAELGVDQLGWLRDDLALRGAQALGSAVERLLRWPVGDRESLVGAVTAGARNLAGGGGSHAAIAGWIERLGGLHPADPGVVVALLLNLVRLRAGDAIHLSAGNLHAYLCGTAVELMASSDNVLRGGLTPKHVDVDELLEVLDPRPLPAPQVPATPIPGGQRYPTDAEHFALERLLPGSGGVAFGSAGPEIVLSLGGTAQVLSDGGSVELPPGQAAFVPAAVARVTVIGDGTVFRATTGTTRPVSRRLEG